MSEAGARRPPHTGAEAEQSTDRRRRKLARLRGLEAESDAAPLAALPPPGTELEGLVLESVLGQAPACIADPSCTSCQYKRRPLQERRTAFWSWRERP